jgi:hypothetical protein
VESGLAVEHVAVGLDCAAGSHDGGYSEPVRVILQHLIHQVRVDQSVSA